MKKACFLLRVKPDRVEEYKEHHRSVDPEMLQALSDAGIRNYSVFLREDGLMVGCFEAENPAESLRKAGETDASARWAEKMNEIFEPNTGEEVAPEWMEQVFYFE